MAIPITATVQGHPWDLWGLRYASCHRHRRPLGHRPKRSIGERHQLLNQRMGQDALRRADLADLVPVVAQLIRQR